MPKVGMMSTALFHSLGYNFQAEVGYKLDWLGGVDGGDAPRMLLGDGFVACGNTFKKGSVTGFKPISPRSFGLALLADIQWDFQQ